MRIASGALGAVLVMAATLTASTAGAERLSLDLQIRETVDKIFTSDLKACKAQSGKLAKLIADPAFPNQSPRTQGMAQVAVLTCAKDGSPQALAAAQNLVKLQTDPRLIYFGHETLLNHAQEREATDDYLTHLYALIDGDPSLIADWEPWRVQWIQRQLRGDPAKEAELLTKLHAVPWTNQTLRDMDQNSWAVSRARQMVEAGDKAKARSALTSVTRVDDLLTVAQDRRFEPLWHDLEADGRFDWVKIAQADLASEQARMKAAPNTLEPVSDVIGSLRSLGRYDEAIALGEAYATRLRAGDTFTDAKDHRSWMLNSLAYAYFDVGRYDESDKVILEAVGKDLVSQAINRAILFNQAGKPNEALKALETVNVKQTAKYGLMLVDSTTVCARVQLGDKAAAETRVATMRTRWKDNAGALGVALLCLDAQDELAALYIKRLEDPAERAGALSAFRTGIPTPKRAPHAVMLGDRDEAVRARPDVAAALRKWGRPLTVPLWGEV